MSSIVESLEEVVNLDLEEVVDSEIDPFFSQPIKHKETANIKDIMNTYFFILGPSFAFEIPIYQV